MEQTQPQPEIPSLALTDLVLLLNLIRASAERGSIRAEEMAEVGTVYQKLVKFLEASGALKPANPPAINEEPDQSASN
jgi:hypothetical protein